MVMSCRRQRIARLVGLKNACVLSVSHVYSDSRARPITSPLSFRLTSHDLVGLMFMGLLTTRNVFLCRVTETDYSSWLNILCLCLAVYKSWFLAEMFYVCNRVSHCITVKQEVIWNIFVSQLMIGGELGAKRRWILNYYELEGSRVCARSKHFHVVKNPFLFYSYYGSVSWLTRVNISSWRSQVVSAQPHPQGFVLGLL